MPNRDKLDTNQNMPFFPIMLGVAMILAIVAVIFIYIGINDILNASASAGWPHTSGKVISSRVTASQREVKRDNYTETVTDYTPVVTYQYTVNDRTYRSQTISFSFGDTGSWTAAYSIQAKYPDGTPVQVYYSPDNPALGVLEPGVSTNSFAPLFMGALFAIGAGVSGFVAFFVRRVLASAQAPGEHSVEQELSTSKKRIRRAENH